MARYLDVECVFREVDFRVGVALSTIQCKKKNVVSLMFIYSEAIL